MSSCVSVSVESERRVSVSRECEKYFFNTTPTLKAYSILAPQNPALENCERSEKFSGGEGGIRTLGGFYSSPR